MSFLQMNEEAVLEFFMHAEELKHLAEAFHYSLWLYKQSHKEDPYWLESLYKVTGAIREIEKLAHIPDYVELKRISVASSQSL